MYSNKSELVEHLTGGSPCLLTRTGIHASIVLLQVEYQCLTLFFILDHITLTLINSSVLPVMLSVLHTSRGITSIKVKL